MDMITGARPPWNRVTGLPSDPQEPSGSMRAGLGSRPECGRHPASGRSQSRSPPSFWAPAHDGVGNPKLTVRDGGREPFARCSSAGRASALQATGPERCSLQDWDPPENPSVIGCHQTSSAGAIPPQ